MLISKLNIKNFKSFGNNEQVLTLDKDVGKLILMVGKNGAGKTTIMDAFDYTFFNKVKGKNKKWVTLSKLPNRINNSDMLNTVEFESNSTTIKIERGQLPNVLRLYENGIENDRAGKSNINDLIEKYIGMDIDSFKSFISMSINDFKNFISLSPADKKLLLDKLFNLEVINTMNDILKQKVKDNKTYIISLDKEISTLDESVQSIKKSIQKFKEQQEENLDNDIALIKENILSKKDEYNVLNSKITKIKEKEKELNLVYENERGEVYTYESEIKQIEKQLNVYGTGKCPTCNSDLTTDEHTSIKSSLIEKKDSIIKVKDESQDKLSHLKTKKKELSGIYNDANESFSDLKGQLRSMKRDLEKLETKQNSDKSTEVEEFFNAIKEMESKKEIATDESEKSKNKMMVYKELAKVFSESGVKKTIIRNILDPINSFIAENLEFMRLPFQVVLDDTFNAKIMQLGEVVDSETLSTGEMKKVNVSIMLAYLKLIRTKKNINILFLDEVLSSIDIEGIDDILNLLKNFANEYNINIFVVHHAQLETQLFDRIIMLEKDIFSTINEL